MGDWGYCLTDPTALNEEIKKRNLVLCWARRSVAMKYPAAHAEGVLRLKTARTVGRSAATPAPFLCLQTITAPIPRGRALQARVTPSDGLTPAEWKTFASGAESDCESCF